MGDRLRPFVPGGAGASPRHGGPAGGQGRGAPLRDHETRHAFRHSFATEALRGGCNIRTLQHVMGHKDIRTTMIDLHVVEQTGHHIRSPLDRPDDPDDCDVPAVDRPWAGVETGWDLAALQWDPARYSGPTPAAPVTR